jgi:hypothetical protein
MSAEMPMEVYSGILMFADIQKQAVRVAMERKRAAGLDVRFLPLKEPGKEFCGGFFEYGLSLTKGALEKQLYLHIYPTFESKFTGSDLPAAYVSRIEKEIDDFWNASSDEKLKGLVDIS